MALLSLTWLFLPPGKHSRAAAASSLSNPLYMDNVGCYGTEAKLTDCAYHRETSDDHNSGVVWIDCSTAEHSESSTESKSNYTLSTAVALVALIGFVLLLTAVAGFILCTKNRCIRKKISLS